MATLTFNMTIADGEVAELRAALKIYFNTPAASDAELIEAMRQAFMVQLKNIVQSTNQRLGMEAAAAADYTITVT